MDLTLIAVIIAIFALIVVAGFLVFRQRSNVEIKGPFQTGLKLDASNDPPQSHPAVDAEDITSREGGILADDQTGRGVKARRFDAKDDVLLSSSGPKDNPPA